MGIRNRAEPSERVENRLKTIRISRGLSQSALAAMAGITRQAVYAMESDQYLPTTGVALRLAEALNCRVEDLFSLMAAGEELEGELIGPVPTDQAPSVRVKVARVGDRVVVRPVAQLGEVLNFTVAADGLISTGRPSGGSSRGVKRVRVRLLRDRREMERTIVVAGCDPAIFLAGDHLRRRLEKATVVGWTMGSRAALEALKRQEVHMAGLHLVDAKSGESNLPYLRRHLRGQDVTVVTFASWEQGLMVQAGNPKSLRGIEDLARKDIVLINREEGSGARLLLDQRLTALGIKPAQVRGYDRVTTSHLEVARLIAEGQARVGVGVRAAAQLRGLEFLPLQEERYDLVMPTAYVASHPGVTSFLDMMVSRPFRTEIEALGGYDTRETGKIQELGRQRSPVH